MSRDSSQHHYYCELWYSVSAHLEHKSWNGYGLVYISQANPRIVDLFIKQRSAASTFDNVRVYVCGRPAV